MDWRRLADMTMNPFDRVKQLSEPELLNLAQMDPNTGMPDVDALLGAARGEYAERRAIRLAKRFPGVAGAYKATEWENRHQATDVIVVMRGGRKVPLQIKARRAPCTDKELRTAKEHKIAVVQLPADLTDDEVRDRLRGVIDTASTGIDTRIIDS
jgi:hypothetical protein